LIFAASLMIFITLESGGGSDAKYAELSTGPRSARDGDDSASIAARILCIASTELVLLPVASLRALYNASAATTTDCAAENRGGSMALLVQAEEGGGTVLEGAGRLGGDRSAS
jgi:hypothetical protein